MKRLVVTLTLVLASTALPGCLSVAETQHDHEKIRTALNTLYENQIIDNLIRAANGVPFVQLDYTSATTTVTVTQDGGIGATPSLVTTRDRSTPVKVIALASRVFTNSWSYDLKAGNSNQIALTANPVTDKNGVYDAYLQFLNNPGSLMVSCDPPPPGRAHICREWRGKYYWVPVEHRYLFLQLALTTSFQRGAPLQPPDKFYNVSVVMATPIGGAAADGTAAFQLNLDGDGVPKDTGTIEFTVDGKTSKKFSVVPLDKDRGAAKVASFTITFLPDASDDSPFKTSAAFQKARFPLAAKLVLDHNRPEPKGTDELIQAVKFGLDQIRFNQLRLSTP